MVTSGLTELSKAIAEPIVRHPAKRQAVDLKEKRICKPSKKVGGVPATGTDGR